MMKVHNMAPRELRYGFPCIVHRTVPISFNTIKRGLIIGYVVVNGYNC